VIVLLNGPFGVGKTTVGRLLVERLEGARLFDPERVGFALRRTVARGVSDYQNLRSWRALTVLGARLNRLVASTVVMPMTLWRQDVHDEITAGLRSVDSRVAPFLLTAEERILRARIFADTVEAGARDWRLEHVAPCLAAFGGAGFGHEIDTGQRSPVEVVDEIMAAL
jgi:predicted kinase